MTRKWAITSKGLLFACGLLVGLIFLFLVPREAAGRLQLAYAHAFRRPLALGRGLVRVSQTTTPPQSVSPQDYESLLKAIQLLRNEVANLRAQLQERNRQIELLTKLKAKPGLEHMQLIPAKVYTHVQDEMTISQGQESGVAVGQYVLSLADQCVIGVVSAVSAKRAKVRLITDRDSRIPVNIAGLSAGKYLEGRGDGVVKIPKVPRQHVLQAGAVVYAQAQRGLLDVQVIVAEIAECKADVDNPLVWDITARPACACDLAALSDVVVLKPAP